MERISNMGNDGANIGIAYGHQHVPAITVPEQLREKYWGDIRTIFHAHGVIVKRIFMRAGTQSSLEFHCKKWEHYYIESGKLSIGMRIRRAENVSIMLEAGQCVMIEPGMMHMRIAHDDTVIIETSADESDDDSHIVEDGMTYVHACTHDKEH